MQETLKADPHAGHLFVFRGKRGDLIKVIWHDGQGACLFSKRLGRRPHKALDRRTPDQAYFNPLPLRTAA